MTRTPAVRLLLAGLLLLVGGVTQARAQSAKYAPADMLDPSLAPKHDDVAISTPTREELKSCTVVFVQGSAKGSGGYLLLDAKKQPLRRFFASKAGGSIDIWSYYKDGVEVYREFDTASKGAPNNFRWLNAGGMKWGVGTVSAGKASINAWRMISAEETAFEAFQAVAKSDFGRLQALLISDSEMQMVKLPAGKMKTIVGGQQQAQKKFAELVLETKLASVKFDGVETAIPQCDTTLDVEMLIKHASRAVRYETANAKNEKQHGWLHTGEMIQVGMAWRLVDVPLSKDPLGTDLANQNPIKTGPANPALEKAQNDLAEHDRIPTPSAGIGDQDAKVHAYYLKRIELLYKIIDVDADGRDGWYKQLFDNMTALAQNAGDSATVGKLNQLKDSVVKQAPGTNLAAYGTYRCMWTDYALALAKKPAPAQQEIIKLQEKWLDDLSGFVQKYSKAEDTPEALNQLAVGSEFNGKIETAKRWYQELVTGFPEHQQTARARGSLARLNLVGNAMTLSAPLLGDSTKQFNLADLKSKVVIVHFWASYSDQYQDDFAKLNRILNQVAEKQNVVLVSINLDEDAVKARAAVAKAQAPGVHLFQANNNAYGLSSPLATQYGIHILPTLFMVGRDGRVTSNSLQIGDIETELKKIQ
jgi:thiol-disulfide isomerase/thioredoxin